MEYCNNHDNNDGRRWRPISNGVKKLFLLLLLISSPLWAVSFIDLIDVPTAQVVDYHSVDLNFRFYGAGGLLTRFNFGVVRNINLGVYFDVERAIGNQKADINVPKLLVKARLFPGTNFLPSLCLGYDAQGYCVWNYKKKKFISGNERGLYLVVSKEILIPGLEVHIGSNVALETKEEKDELFPFFGASFNLNNNFVFSAEWDHVQAMSKGRANFGIRYFISPSISIEIAARDLARKVEQAERILHINYTSTF